LASVATDQLEQERLFSFGYTQGRKFLDALRENKISQADRSSIVPSGFLMVAEGPTADFILGRVFEAAQENALKNVFVTDGKLNSNELRESIAKNRHQTQNCALIGRSK